ncbi:MAG: DMT family transporter [Thiohalomonadaceae bacterium]
MHVALLTAIAMLAFAGNSLLCRMALGSADAIDPASYTAVRLVAGAAALALILRLRTGPGTRAAGSWGSAAWLFLYAIACSWAYLSLDTGIGALILFGAVQVTMIGLGIVRGERPRPLQWLGIVTAMGGLAYLLSPGLTAPSFAGAMLMSGAGVAWGMYSLRGKGAADPLAATAGNFLRAVPMGVLLLVLMADRLHLPLTGVLLGVLSGAVTSGVGYAIWYAAVRGLSAYGAAVVQLSAPVIATYAGVVLLDEALTLRIVLASVAILGGIAIALRRSAPADVPRRRQAAPERVG